MELAKAEMKMIQLKREELERSQLANEDEMEALKKAEEGRRKIYYSWPSFCRDLVSPIARDALRVIADINSTA